MHPKVVWWYVRLWAKRTAVVVFAVWSIGAPLYIWSHFKNMAALEQIQLAAIHDDTHLVIIHLKDYELDSRDQLHYKLFYDLDNPPGHDASLPYEPAPYCRRGPLQRKDSPDVVDIDTFTFALRTKAPYLAVYAAQFYQAAQETGMDPFLLAAICDRESRGGKALRSSGWSADGFGCGLMQIDRRYHSDFCNGPLAHDPQANISKGAEILRSYFDRLWNRPLPGIKKDATLKASVAAYNAGPVRVRQALNAGEDPDFYTTGQDYSAWVLRRVTQLKGSTPDLPEDPQPPPSPPIAEK